jgi:protein-S-isoprenylcysteine O-methyltransferase Ste14
MGEYLGLISGWGLFGGWIIIWVSPQPQFIVAVLEVGPTLLGVSLLRVLVASLGVASGAWLGIKGVMDLSLRIAETHRPTEVIETGIYQKIRHPQYLGACLAHLGITLFLRGSYSLVCTPVVFGVIWVLAWKEEQELIREFGSTYLDYQTRTGGFLPRHSRNKSTQA